MSRNDDNEFMDDVQQLDKSPDYAMGDLLLTVRWLTVQHQKTWRPATDVYETDDSVVVRVEVAGVRERDFTVSLSNRNLVITGFRRDDEPKLAYQQLEIPYGHFRTQVFLPYAVEQEEISAFYKDGLLTVVLPKVKAKKIQVRQANAATSHQVE